MLPPDVFSAQHGLPSMKPMAPMGGQPAQSPFSAFLASQARAQAMVGPHQNIGQQAGSRVGGTQFQKSGNTDEGSGDSDPAAGQDPTDDPADDDPQGYARGGIVEPEEAVWKPQPGAPQVPPADDDEDDNRPHEPPPKEQSAAAGGSIEAYDDGGAIEQQEDPGDVQADATPDEQTDERRRAKEEQVARDNDQDQPTATPPQPQAQGGIPDDAEGGAPPAQASSGTGTRQAIESHFPKPAGGNADPDKEDWTRNSAAALRSGYDWLKQQFGLGDAVPGPDYAKGVANYHSGTGAASHEDAEAVEAAADPHRQLSDQERSTKALSDVHDFYGDQSGEKVGSLLQRMRQLYHSYASHAAVALEQGDIAAGVKSANEALSNIPGPVGYTVEQAREAMRHPIQAGFFNRGSRNPNDDPTIPGRPGSAAYEAIKARRQTPERADEQEAAALGEKTSKPKQEAAAPAIPDDRSGDEDTAAPANERTKVLSTPEGGYSVPDRGPPTKPAGAISDAEHDGAPIKPQAAPDAEYGAPLIMVAKNTATGREESRTPVDPRKLGETLQKTDFDKAVMVPITIMRGGQASTYMVPRYDGPKLSGEQEMARQHFNQGVDAKRPQTQVAPDLPKIVGTYSGGKGGTMYKLSDGRLVNPATYNAEVRTAQQGRQGGGGGRGSTPNPETERHNRAIEEHNRTTDERNQADKARLGDQTMHAAAEKAAEMAGGLHTPEGQQAHARVMQNRGHVEHSTAPSSGPRFFNSAADARAALQSGEIHKGDTIDTPAGPRTVN